MTIISPTNPAFPVKCQVFSTQIRVWSMSIIAFCGRMAPLALELQWSCEDVKSEVFNFFHAAECLPPCKLSSPMRLWFYMYTHIYIYTHYNIYIYTHYNIYIYYTNIYTYTQTDIQTYIHTYVCIIAYIHTLYVHHRWPVGSFDQRSAPFGKPRCGSSRSCRAKLTGILILYRLMVVLHLI